MGLIWVNMNGRVESYVPSYSAYPLLSFKHMLMEAPKNASDGCYIVVKFEVFLIFSSAIFKMLEMENSLEKTFVLKVKICGIKHNFSKLFLRE